MRDLDTSLKMITADLTWDSPDEEVYEAQLDFWDTYELHFGKTPVKEIAEIWADYVPYEFDTCGCFFDYIKKIRAIA